MSFSTLPLDLLIFQGQTEKRDHLSFKASAQGRQRAPGVAVFMHCTSQVIKALLSRGLSQPIPPRLQPGISVPFFSSPWRMKKCRHVGKTIKRDGKKSAGCGSDYRLCCLGPVHVASNRDQCNLAFRQRYRESDSLLQRATVACAVSNLVSS